jgi:hypothetical protein
MRDRRRPPLRMPRAAITAALLCVALGAGAVYATTASATACDTFTPTSGNSGDWFTGGTWSAGAAPASTSVLACWASNVTVTIAAGEAATAASINGTGGGAAGPLDIDEGSITLGTDLSEVSQISGLQTTSVEASTTDGGLNGSGTVDVSGAFTMNGGQIGASGTPTINSASFSVSDAADAGSNFDAGAINVDGPAYIGSLYFLAATGGSGQASFTETSPTDPITFIPGAYPENDGYMLMSSAGGYAISGYTDVLNYRITQTGGTTDIPSGEGLLANSSFTVSGGTVQDDGTINETLVDLTGGTLDGTGSVDSTLENTSGTVSPGDPGVAGGIGTLTALGYIQGSDGTLTTPVGGVSAGQYSVLHSSGGAQLAGTLALEPDTTFAGSATPGQFITFLPYGGTLTGAFDATTVSQPLQNGESFGPQYSDAEVNALVGAGEPSDTTPPVISGPTQQGDTLSTTNGTWTDDPSSYTYQWQDCPGGVPSSIRSPDVTSVCSAISGATSNTYTLQASDVGMDIEVVVTAITSPTTNASAVSNELGPVTAPTGATTTTTTAATTTTTTTTTTAVAPPSGGATVRGTALPGDRLTCVPGTWTGAPTFTYQWMRGSSAIAGAIAATYTVTILDEGSTITCVVTGHNAGGSKSTVAKGVIIAQKGTLTCPKPSGTFTTAKVGRLALGASRATERRTLTRYTITHYGFDNFCLYGGWGIRAGYRSSKVVLLLTANPYYKLHGVSPGIAIKTISKRLHVGKVIPIGLNDWYIAPGDGANYVFKVRKGIIQEIGIASKRDTAGSLKNQRAFLSGFKAV